PRPCRGDRGNLGRLRRGFALLCGLTRLFCLLRRGCIHLLGVLWFFLPGVDLLERHRGNRGDEVHYVVGDAALDYLKSLGHEGRLRNLYHEVSRLITKQHALADFAWDPALDEGANLLLVAVHLADDLDVVDERLASQS